MPISKEKKNHSIFYRYLMVKRFKSTFIYFQQLYILYLFVIHNTIVILPQFIQTNLILKYTKEIFQVLLWVLIIIV